MLAGIDGAGASPDVIDHPTSCDTAPRHSRRARRVAYRIGWPVDEPTVAGIEQLHDSDGGAALHTNGEADPAAHVTDMTEVIRHNPGRDQLTT